MALEKQPAASLQRQRAWAVIAAVSLTREITPNTWNLLEACQMYSSIVTIKAAMSAKTATRNAFLPVGQEKNRQQQRPRPTRHTLQFLRVIR
jgi:hypothetical protein